MWRSLGFIAMISAGSTMLPAPVQAESNLLFILDSSGSMWGKLEGQAKMDTAKTSLANLVNDLPAGTKLGLMVYGHRYDRKHENACADIEVVMPVGQAVPDQVAGTLKQITPKGKTPIAAALGQAADAFAGLEAGNNNVVLISDGLETCDGNPCAVAGKLAEANINVRVHVVGFDIKEEDRAQLECIAQLGKGKYFPAKSTEGFAQAVSEAVEVAQAEAPPEAEPEPKPEPPKPAGPVVYFEDNFDGDELAEHWEVVNPDPDSFIVENGVMTVIMADPPPAKISETPNLLRLAKPLPKGDWTAIMKYRMEPQTFRERTMFGPFKDDGSYLMGTMNPATDYYVYFAMGATKMSGGKPTSFGDSHPGGAGPNNGNFAGNLGFDKFVQDAKTVMSDVYVKLEKKGRQYFVSAKLVNADDPSAAAWHTLSKLTSLKLPSDTLVIAFSQGPYGNKKTQLPGGEAIADLDWVKIEAPPQPAAAPAAAPEPASAPPSDGAEQPSAAEPAPAEPQQ